MHSLPTPSKEFPIKVDDLAQVASASVGYLEWIAGRVENHSNFLVFSYRNSRGGVRQIVSPDDLYSTVCKNLHRALSAELDYTAPRHVHGFVKGRSTTTNATEHLAKDCVLRVDLHEFFPSITFDAVMSALMREGLDAEASRLTARIVTIDGSLPIGLSTSPLISNLVFWETDHALVEFADASGLQFTRYVDDLIFSGDGISNETLRQIQFILESRGWAINNRKTAFMRRGGPQYVTGLYVGRLDGPHLPRRVKRRLRFIQHMIEKIGFDDFVADFSDGNGALLSWQLKGWARHAASIEPDFGYKLWRSFDEHISGGYPRRMRVPSPADIEILQQIANSRLPKTEPVDDPPIEDWEKRVEDGEN